VQDFKGGPHGWVIVSFAPTGTHVVRNGMLWGWFDNHGATGKLGCPTRDEYGYRSSSTMAGVRQDFQHGSMYWLSGMNHAALISSRQEAAIGWAWSHLNTVFWPGLCLQFAVYSYYYTGWHLTGPYGKDVRAVDWWGSNLVPSPRHPGDKNPPRGALVFWSTYAKGTGHAAISLGGGWAISTEFGGSAAVHVFKIASYPTHYLGWRNPA
jgi:hypothetical protein